MASGVESDGDVEVQPLGWDWGCSLAAEATFSRGQGGLGLLGVLHVTIS